MTTLKYALIGATSAACLIAGALLVVTPAKAEPVIGDVRSFRPDPGYRDHDYRSRDIRDGRDFDERRFRFRPFEPVRASGSVAGNLPAHLKHWRAERIAIEQWQRAVADTMGPAFARWRDARDRQTSCETTAAKVVCLVQAVPARGDIRWRRYGWN